MRKKDETMPAADAGPVERKVRPQCWAFAMEFLGEPEAPVVEAYVASLEAEIARLHAALVKIADWHGAWGPWPENNEAWRAMAVVTAREAVPELRPNA